MQSTFKQQIAAIQKARGAYGLTKKTRDNLHEAENSIAGWVFLKTALENRIKEIRREIKRDRNSLSVSVSKIQQHTELRVLEQIVGRCELPIRYRK